ncbi:hypothetical protein EAH_00049340 [Eimeria acervulina]|uniref:Uncharacterized protein n=1 Tax=Eimeria acervulina TaxID=5801 RepID=U6GVE9_EIMAC|nr:hypothetical protein EAH_00049340 [Eimeria acervulina]CDI84160.1 hypothetical protein EAH_00049340 [Eimeria acervulina]
MRLTITAAVAVLMTIYQQTPEAPATAAATATTAGVVAGTKRRRAAAERNFAELCFYQLRQQRESDPLILLWVARHPRAYERIKVQGTPTQMEMERVRDAARVVKNREKLMQWLNTHQASVQSFPEAMGMRIRY